MLLFGDLLGEPTEEYLTLPPMYDYEMEATDLAARIDAGEFAPGAKLPSRRELVEHYGVTEPVIDKAMMILRLQGRTETLPGVGVFVREA